MVNPEPRDDAATTETPDPDPPRAQDSTGAAASPESGNLVQTAEPARPSGTAGTAETGTGTAEPPGPSGTAGTTETGTGTADVPDVRGLPVELDLSVTGSCPRHTLDVGEERVGTAAPASDAAVSAPETRQAEIAVPTREIAPNTSVVVDLTPVRPFGGAPGAETGESRGPTPPDGQDGAPVPPDGGPVPRDGAPVPPGGAPVPPSGAPVRRTAAREPVLDLDLTVPLRPPDPDDGPGPSTRSSPARRSVPEGRASARTVITLLVVGVALVAGCVGGYQEGRRSGIRQTQEGSVVLAWATGVIGADPQRGVSVHVHLASTAGVPVTVTRLDLGEEVVVRLPEPVRVEPGSVTVTPATVVLTCGARVALSDATALLGSGEGGRTGTDAVPLVMPGDALVAPVVEKTCPAGTAGTTSSAGAAGTETAASP
ncbi:MAG: hypothetical protein GXX79_11010 [Actinomycetales bacterium]|nr:hypothetical protein [Actinomycetales bacterium]